MRRRVMRGTVTTTVALVAGIAMVLLAPSASAQYGEPLEPPEVGGEVIVRPVDTPIAPRAGVIRPVPVSDNAANGPQVAGVQLSRSAPGLAVTGGDVVGLAALGGAMIALGVTIVASRRRRPASATSLG